MFYKCVFGWMLVVHVMFFSPSFIIKFDPFCRLVVASWVFFFNTKDNKFVEAPKSRTAPLMKGLDLRCLCSCFFFSFLSYDRWGYGTVLISGCQIIRNEHFMQTIVHEYFSWSNPQTIKLSNKWQTHMHTPPNKTWNKEYSDINMFINHKCWNSAWVIRR